MPAMSKTFYAATKLQSLAIITSGHYSRLLEMSETYSVPMADLLLFDAHIQLNPGTTMEELMQSCQMSQKNKEKVATALHLAGWIRSDSALYGEAFDGDQICLPRALASNRLPSLVKKWSAVWNEKTGEDLSAPEISAALERRIYSSKGYPLPTPDPVLVDVFFAVREAVLIDTFFYDIAKFYPDMLFAVAVGVPEKAKISGVAGYRMRVFEISTQWSNLMPGWTSSNHYLFHAMAAFGVIAADILRAFAICKTPAALKDGAILEAKRRLNGGTSGLIDLGNITKITK